jgi:hypothetical protein
MAIASVLNLDAGLLGLSSSSLYIFSTFVLTIPTDAGWLAVSLFTIRDGTLPLGRNEKWSLNWLLQEESYIGLTLFIILNGQCQCR